jgi:hypothetical protein
MLAGKLKRKYSGRTDVTDFLLRFLVHAFLSHHAAVAALLFWSLTAFGSILPPRKLLGQPGRIASR